MNKNGKSRKNRIILAALIFLITGIYSCTAHGEPVGRPVIENFQRR